MSALPVLAVSYFDPATGRISGGLQDRLDLIEANRPAGEGWIEGTWDPSLHYVRDLQAHVLPPKPGPWAVWDLATETWTDPRPAAERAVALEVARWRAEAWLAAWLDSQAGRITRPVPASEVASWPAKEAAALAYLDVGPDAMVARDLDLLQREASRTGETVPELVSKVAPRAAAFRIVAPILAAVRRNGGKAIALSPDEEAMDAAIAAAQAAWLADPDIIALGGA